MGDPVLTLDLLAAQLHVQVDVLLAELSEPFPFGLLSVELHMDTTKFLFLLLDLLNDLQVSFVLSREHRAIEHLLRNLHFSYARGGNNVLLDVVS